MKETGQLRAWNVIQAELWSPLSVCIRRLQVQLRQTEHVHRGHHRNMQRLDAESWQLSPRQEYMVICCPPGMPQLCPLTLQLSPRSGADRSWESQAHRSTEPGTATLIPTATMSWSPAPVYHSLVIWDEHKREGCDLDCFWELPWTYTQVLHRFTMTVRVSLSAITAFRADCPLKDNGTWSNLTLKAHSPATREKTPPLTATKQRGGPTSSINTTQALDTTPITPPIKGIMARRLWGKMWMAYIQKTVLATKILDTHILHRDAPT